MPITCLSVFIISLTKYFLLIINYNLILTIINFLVFFFFFF